MLQIENISKTYEGKPLLQEVSLHVGKGEILCLLGPSGSGKSTLLRIIAGLEEPENGRVYWNQEDITGVPVNLRNFGFMFQDYALFPHMNVWQNVAYGLTVRGGPEDFISKTVADVLRMVEMAEFANRSVLDLSGGEKQRVALARAIAPKPRLLMLDEPLGSLDRTLHDQLILELGIVLSKLETPVIYVTHDQEEAFSIGTQMAVLNDTKIVQNDSPESIYSKPASRWLAGFLGFNNQIPGIFSESNQSIIQTEIGMFQGIHSQNILENGRELILVLKPDGIVNFGNKKGINTIKATVQECLFFGDRYRLVLALENNYQFTFFHGTRLEVDRQYIFKIAPESILCYPRKNE